MDMQIDGYRRLRESDSSAVINRIAKGFALTALLATWGAGSAQAYPGGTPDFQTDVAPYCAACHTSTSEGDLSGLGDRALAELPLNKHYAAIRAGAGRYGEVPEADRAKLVELLALVDKNSTIALEFPASVEPGETFQVTVKVTGGAGPAVAVALVDRAHRFFAKPASSLGWEVVGAPTIIGPKGPQTAWIERRPEREGRNITYVNVDDMQSSADQDKWSRAKIIFTLQAPAELGDYPLVGAYFYGTETGTSLSTRMHPELGAQPLGGTLGKSGRIKFSTQAVISVKVAGVISPVADIAP
jgi:hypothetical protein